MPGIRNWFGRGLNEDWVDRANGFWSVLLLAICSAGTFISRYVTQSISCWTPAHFTADHSMFSRQTCFTNAMFYEPLSASIPMHHQERSEMSFSYHLWIPVILFFQALCFKIPNFIWNFGKYYLTLNIDSTVETLKQALAISPETQKSVSEEASRILGKIQDGKKFILCILYLVVKLLFCLNLIGQLVFLTICFRNSLVVKAGSYVNVDLGSVIKPLLTKHGLCDFDIRIMHIVHRYTVQCVLPITEIYEKMFVLLWFCFLLLAVITFFNLILWAGFLFIPFFRDGRITIYIKAISESPQDSSVVTRFIGDFLGFDGVLVLSLISRNSNEMVAAQLSQQLYLLFMEQERPGPRCTKQP